MFVLSGLIGALIGAAVTFAFNMWKLHRDERSSRCDELCKSINDAAIFASTYWITAYPADEGVSQAIDEAKLFSFQIQIDGLFSSFRLYIQKPFEEELDGELSSLYDCLTGGDYSVTDRPIDLKRATSAVKTASVANLAIRKAHRQSLPFYRMGEAYHQNKKRSLDMPQGWPHGGQACQTNNFGKS